MAREPLRAFSLTLCISCADSDVNTIVRIEGRLCSETAEELLRTCREARLPIVLDLSFLQSADEAGIHALTSLRESGARLEGADPYIRLRIG